MAFPTTGLLDDFNRADTGPPPSGNWTTDIYGDATPGLKVVSNQVVGNAFGNGWWNVTTFGPDSEAYITWPTREAHSFWLRLQTPGSSATDGYRFDFTFSGGAHVYRVDNTVETELGTGDSFSFSSGDRTGAEAIGSSLTPYLDHLGGGFSPGATRTDSTYGGTGNIGLRCASSAVGDDFSGGTVVGGATPNPPHPVYVDSAVDLAASR